MADFNQQVIEEFRANGGRVGGFFEGAHMLLLHTRGAKTGRERVNPLVYLPQGDRMVVFATAGGSPRNPDWYHNLRANPEVSVEVGSDTITAVASEIEDEDERRRLYAAQVEARPDFAQYEKATDRRIPIIALTPTG